MPFADSGFLYTNNFVIHANGASTSQGITYRFPDVPEKHFAEQLTRMDMVSRKSCVGHKFFNTLLPIVKTYF